MNFAKYRIVPNLRYLYVKELQVKTWYGWKTIDSGLEDELRNRLNILTSVPKYFDEEGNEL